MPQLHFKFLQRTKLGFIITIILYYILISIILFGAYIIWRSLPRDRVTTNFIWLLIFFAGIYLLDSLYLILGESGYIPDPRELDYINILLGASSQLYFQYFIYNLLFSRRSAIKWTLWQAVPIIAIVAGKWIGDHLGIFSQFNAVSYDTNLEALICDPIFIIRLTMILVQIAYTAVILLFTSRLIPIYQSYIERTESNSACNIIWIKEVCWLFLSLLIIYTVDALVMNLTTAILYFSVAIYSFSRVVALMLNHYVGGFNLSGDLYSQIGIRWSLKKLWYLPSEKESQHQTLSNEKALFARVEEWIFIILPRL